MKKFYLFIKILLVILFVGILSFFMIIKNIDKNTQSNNTNELSVENKIISSSFTEINPNNYETLDEFLYYFNTGSGINLSVDVEKEIFYTKVVDGDNYTITKFDSSLREYINSSGESIKNEAIVDIFNSYQDNKYIYGEEKGNETFSVRMLEDKELETNFQMHNSLLIPIYGESFNETLARLESKEDKTKDDLEQISYLYDFKGNYEESLKIKKENNEETLTYTVSGNVFKLGDGLRGAKIEVLNYPEIYTFSDNNGNYELSFDTYPMTRLRLRASYGSLSDGFNDLFILYDFDGQSSENVNFSLLNYDVKQKIDYNDLITNGEKIITSSINNSFTFKPSTVYNEDGSVYEDDFYVYVFEFNRNTTGMENFLSIDNFNEETGYLGDIMVTNGMTYLMLKDLNGNELFVKKTNPIITKQNLDIDYLMNNKLGGVLSLSQESLNLMIAKSQEEGYPIDVQFITERNIDGFSPWWVLNRTKGIRENVGIKLYNDYTFEGLFYNVD